MEWLYGDYAACSSHYSWWKPKIKVDPINDCQVDPATLPPWYEPLGG